MAPRKHEESPYERLTRIRRAISQSDKGGDLTFLDTVVRQLGLVASHAIARLDQLSAELSRRDAGDLATFARQSARAVELQSAYFGIWHRTDRARPTLQPNTSVAVLFCTRTANYPKQGFYTTDEAGDGSWEIYSALQDHVLDYRGPEPEIWCLAPGRPDPESWDAITQTDDPALTREPDAAGDGFGRAIATDLTEIGRPDLIAVITALPSLARAQRHTDQVRNAHLRTAEALGVPATAYAPAERAAALVQEIEALRTAAKSPGRTETNI